jgi:hypothetical protein
MGGDDAAGAAEVGTCLITAAGTGRPEKQKAVTNTVTAFSPKAAHRVDG